MFWMRNKENSFPIHTYLEAWHKNGLSMVFNPIVLLFSFFFQVGRIIMQGAAKVNLKRVTLELGGKSPAVVWKDADCKGKIIYI